MTVDGLFGPIEIVEPKVRQIKFKQIKAVYESLTIAEGGR
jgi:DNA repair protein RadC